MPDLPRTRAHLEEGLQKNLWTGFSLAVRSSRQTLELAGGDVPGPNSPVPWYSAGKPVTAAGVLRILEPSPSWESRQMAETLPELAGSYAGSLTLSSILSHQTGLRIAETHLGGELPAVWDYFRKVSPADFNLSPGQASYDPAGGWWLLGQWIGRRTGKSWPDFLENSLLRPAGIESLRFHGPAVPIRERRAGKWIEGESGSGPGAGLVGTAADLARFYEILAAAHLLGPDTLKKMLWPVRQGKVDATFGHIVDFGLGVMLNGNRHGTATVPYGFGTHAGKRAFGHGGARSSIAFADPEAGFTAAVFLNGRVPEAEHQPRMRALLDLLRSELA